MRIPKGRTVLVALTIVGVVASALPDALAYPRPGRTELISTSLQGTTGDRFSRGSSVSPDGRFVAFESRASNLVPEGGGGPDGRRIDLYIRDRVMGTTQRVTNAWDGGDADKTSWGPRFSTDGRYLSFTSEATNLTPDGDSNGVDDVFVHDRETGVTTRISNSVDGGDGNATSREAAISPDGRFVTFTSDASNLIASDTNDVRDIFVHDRETGVTERVSIPNEGGESNGWSEMPSISTDGKIIAFASLATNLVEGETNDNMDIFVRDRELGVTERVSISTRGEQTTEDSIAAYVNATGRFVAFTSYAAELVPGDLQECRWPDYQVNCADVFVHDRSTDVTERVSVTSDGVEGEGESYPASISPDGRFVGFDTPAVELAEDRGEVFSPRGEAYLHDRLSGITERISYTAANEDPTDWSFSPTMSADARWVAFTSNARNIVTGDNNLQNDVFIRDRGPELGIGGLSARSSGPSVLVEGWARFGPRVLAESTDPLADAGPGVADVGGDLTGARIVHRPEEEDLFVRIDSMRIPTFHPQKPRPVGVSGFFGVGVLPGATGTPAMTWILRFNIDDTRHEVRITRGVEPSFGLYRCVDRCELVSELAGGLGTVGEAVVASVPLALLPLDGEATITDVQAASGIGTGDLVLHEFDHSDLPDATIATPRVRIGIAPTGTGEQAVTFDTEADLEDGDFAGTLDRSSLPGGAYEVWGRACMGDPCGSSSVPFTLEPPSPPPTVPPVEMLSITTEGRISLFNPASPVVGSITEIQWFNQSCEVPPATQGVDGYVVEIAPLFGTGTGTASVKGSNASGGYDLDLAFYSDCAFIGQSTTGADEVASIPKSTHFIIVNAAAGTDTDFELTVEAPAPSSPTPTSSSSLSASPTPTEPPPPMPTTLSFTSESRTSGQYSDETLLEARLTDPDGQPINGAKLTFELSGVDSSRTFSAVTDAEGRASVAPVLSERPGSYQLTVRYEGSDDHDPSADTTVFLVEKEDSDMQLSAEGKGANRTATARLSDLDSPGDGIAGRTVHFYADGESIGTAITDEHGIATLKAPPRYRGGKHDFEARFEGDDYYNASTGRDST